MENIIRIDTATAATMNMLKQDIKFMKYKNIGGKYDKAIVKEEAILRSFFDEVLGRSTEAAEITEAA